MIEFPHPPSNRSFGFVFTGVFLVIAGWAIWADSYHLAALLGGFSAFVLLISCYKPQWLLWPNRVWFRFGLLLSKFVNPLIMAILFFFVVTPIGLLRHLFKGSPFSAYGGSADTAWIRRTETTTSDDFTKQY